MKQCPICAGPVFIGLTGIIRCVNDHLLSIPAELALDLSKIIIMLPQRERTPVPAIFQDAFGEGELEV